jgi:SagB-type dehydrogenase family enzyme
MGNQVAHYAERQRYGVRRFIAALACGGAAPGQPEGEYDEELPGWNGRLARRFRRLAGNMFLRSKRTGGGEAAASFERWLPDDAVGEPPTATGGPPVPPVCKCNATSSQKSIGTAVVWLITACFFAACDSRVPSQSQSAASPTPAPEKLRQLNEIPISQLRVMLKGFPGEWRPDSDRSHERPEPPVEKAVPANARKIALVPADQIHLGDMSVREAIANRRSVRDFTDAALSLEELSYLLWATQGVTAVQRDDTGATVQRFRAAPSGGARYPLETYLAINRVTGLAPGLYRYLPSEHQLVVLREDPQLGAQMQTACYGMPAVGGAAVVFIWSAVPYRTEWKYTYLAHRMIAMESGHVCENLYLAAQSCGTGCCAALSYHQPRVDELLGLDGEEEFAIYVASVGKPKVD